MILGIDGSPNGWTVAWYEKPEVIRLREFPDLKTVGAHFSPFTVVAIDMIIGLPDIARQGGRTAEKRARQLLSPRGSVVFSAPCRSAVYAPSYEEALSLSRASSPAKIGLSKQSFYITPKIKELDGYLRAREQWRSVFFETHPELSFWEMNGCQPIPSKHDPEGVRIRKALLKRHHMTPRDTPTKDGIDALACLWSARRLSSSSARCVPEEQEVDQYQLPMRICW